MKKTFIFITVLMAITLTVNAQWEQLGEQMTPAEDSYLSPTLSMAFDSQGVPYIYSISKLDGVPTHHIKKWNGTSWEQVGNDITLGSNEYAHHSPQIVIDSQDNIYIAYELTLLNNDHRAYVKKLVEDNWVEIGFKEISHYSFHNKILLMMDNLDNLYLLYTINDGGDDIKHLEKYNGLSWDFLGLIDEHNMDIRQDYFIDDDNNIWYLYMDGSGLAYQIWNGTNWEEKIDVPTVEPMFPKIIVDDNNMPFISLADYWEQMTYVYNYDGSSWNSSCVLDMAMNGYFSDLTKDEAGNIYVIYSNFYTGKFELKQYDYETQTWNYSSAQPLDGYIPYMEAHNINFEYNNGSFYLFINDQDNIDDPDMLTVLKYTIECPTNPVPANETSDVSTSTTEITWDKTLGATRYDVYFGTTSLDFQETVTTNSYSVTLEPNTEYQWKICSRNDGGVVSGCETWTFDTGITGIINNINNENISIYPNPSNGIFTIQNPVGSLRPAGVSITDITGKTIYNQQLGIHNSQFVIDISNQPTGIYFINIQTESGIYTEKLIIQ